MRVQESVDIRASPEQVWPFLVEPHKVLQWCIKLRAFEYTGVHCSGAGTPVFLEEITDTGGARMHFVVSEWSEFAQLGLKMVSGANYARYERHCVLASTLEGTRVTYVEDLDLPYGIFAGVMEPLVEQMSAAAIRTMLLKLKALAEAAASAPLH